MQLFLLLAFLPDTDPEVGGANREAEAPSSNVISVPSRLGAVTEVGVAKREAAAPSSNVIGAPSRPGAVTEVGGAKREAVAPSGNVIGAPSRPGAVTEVGGAKREAAALSGNAKNAEVGGRESEREESFSSDAPADGPTSKNVTRMADHVKNVEHGESVLTIPSTHAGG